MKFNYPATDNNTIVYMTQLMLFIAQDISNLIGNKHHVKAIKTIINCKFLSHFLELASLTMKIIVNGTTHVPLHSFKDNNFYLLCFFPSVTLAYNPVKRCF